MEVSNNSLAEKKWNDGDIHKWFILDPMQTFCHWKKSGSMGFPGYFIHLTPLNGKYCNSTNDLTQ